MAWIDLGEGRFGLTPGLLEADTMTDFLTMLGEMQNGQVAIEISREFQDMLDGVKETNMPGEINIKLKVAPKKRKDGEVEIKVDYDSKVKRPKLSLGSSYYFLDQQGDLARDHPSQTKMFEPDAKTASTGEKR
jgi:hypothetical protein